MFHNGSHYDYKLILREIFPDTISEESYEEDIDNIGGDIEDILLNNHDHVTDDNSNSSRLMRKKYKLEEVNIIARSTEDFISFEKKVTERFSVHFLDSYRFMASSLSALSNNLPRENFKHVAKFYKNEKFHLACQKGIFPYEYITDLSKYEETSLPPIEAFYSSLNKDNITAEECNHAQKVYKEFQCQSLGEYSDHYVQIDTLLLTDIFEHFRDICHNVYKLDALWTYSAPGLSWQAMLKSIGVNLELIKDSDMYLFMEEGIRGGFCGVTKRYAKANNREMGEDYNEQLPTSYIAYFDANNLYGYSMLCLLPYSGYKMKMS